MRVFFTGVFLAATMVAAAFLSVAQAHAASDAFTVRLPYTPVDIALHSFREDGGCAVIVEFVQKTQILGKQIINDGVLRNLPKFVVLLSNGAYIEMESLAPMGDDAGGGGGKVFCQGGKLLTEGDSGNLLKRGE